MRAKQQRADWRVFLIIQCSTKQPTSTNSNHPPPYFLSTQNFPMCQDFCSFFIQQSTPTPPTPSSLSAKLLFWYFDILRRKRSGPNSFAIFYYFGQSIFTRRGAAKATEMLRRRTIARPTTTYIQLWTLKGIGRLARWTWTGRRVQISTPLCPEIQRKRMPIASRGWRRAEWMSERKRTGNRFLEGNISPSSSSFL